MTEFRFNVGDIITDQAFPGRKGHKVVDLRVDQASGVKEVLVDHNGFCVWHIENNLRLWNPRDANPLPWE